MALRASSKGLVVLCFVSLLLVSSFADTTSRAQDTGRKMKRELVAADEEYAPLPPSYGVTPPLPPSYGPPSQTVPTYTPTQP
ncbi:hypothetical protein SEVIR_6G092200v4 [Setaria viridis]|uniref:Uncharacterized protein n=1 Tax=Setaria viridis TaxID=4556 RepID=A0A4U6U7L3_SETVI|nr:hypothetical protein SEVIR_6G092200v2 [Setaria viridis]